MNKINHFKSQLIKWCWQPEHKQQLKGLIYLTPILLLSIIFIVMPFINAFYEGLKQTTIYDRVNYTIGIENFHQVVQSSMFAGAFYYSNLMLFVGMPIGLLLGIAFALLINTIINRLFKSVVISVLFSQFFISSFAIGVAFIYLFDGNKNAFNFFFHTNLEWTKGNNNLLVLFIFEAWRIWPFNTVIFLFYFSNQKKKYSQIMQVDQLKLIDKWINVYFKGIAKTMLLMLYINALEAILLNPMAIYTAMTLETNNVATFAYYIYYYLKIVGSPQFGLVGAASIIVLSYLILIFSISGLIYWLIWHKQIHHKKVWSKVKISLLKNGVKNLK